MKRLTLEEIGKLAGVSRATVSRVVNNYPHIRPEVRQRVQKVIAETGYQPNFAARSLASNRSRVIGLIIPTVLQAAFTDPYYPHLVRGISSACNQNDYTVSLFLFQSQQEERQMIKRIIGNGLSDGLILTTDHNNSPLIALLKDHQLPFVLIGRPSDEQANGVSYVDVDNIGGGYAATAHLIQLGRRRIAQIATNHNTAGIDRSAGYRRALDECGYPIDESLISYADFTEEGGYATMTHLLTQRPDAVFAQSDAIAIGAMKAIREAGLRVPDDIAVVSFDDVPLAERAEPPLTTVRQPIHENGALAIETLVDLIENAPADARQTVLPVELVIRASCGAVN